MAASMTQPDVLLPRKFFIPLENNPQVFTHLSTVLGARHLTFSDIYSLSPACTTHIPRPVHALILNCSPASFRSARETEAASLPVYEGCGEKEPVLWFKQTINHACGLIALLHALGNGEVGRGGSGFVEVGSELERILKEAVPLKVIPRANVLTASEKLEKAHFDAANQGSTQVPDPMDPSDGHFICFVKGRDGHLWELNGGINGPIDRGDIGDEDEDVLSEKAVRLGVQTILVKATDNDVQFSIVAMSLDKHGDDPST